MGKKMHEKDGHKRENKRIEEGNRDGGKNKIEADNDEKKDQIKKRKTEFDTDKKEHQSAHKKHKKSKDVAEVEEISMETCLGGKENTEQESSKDKNLENNEVAKRVRKGKHKKNRDGLEAVGTGTETFEHSKMPELVEAQKICSPEDINKTLHEKEEANEKRKKKKQKPEKVNGNVADDIAVMSSLAGENVAGEENSAGTEIEQRKLQDIGGDAEDGNGRKKKKKSKSVKSESHAESLTESVEAQKICTSEDINMTVHGKEEGYRKRKKDKKKQKTEKANGSAAVTSSIADENGTGKENSAGDEVECRKLRDIGGDAGDGNGRKKKSKSVKNDSEGGHHKGDAEDGNGQQKKKSKSVGKKSESGDHKGDARTRSVDTTNQVEDGNGQQKKKSKSVKKKSESGDHKGDAEDGNGQQKKKSKSVKTKSESGDHKGDARIRSVDTTNQVENGTPKEKSKKVSFSDQVEVFPSTGVTDDENKDGEEGLVRGKRYSKEEDEIVMNAVTEYVDNYNLGDEGIDIVMNCKLHKEARNCWKEIQKAIPWRPISSVYSRAHVLFERESGQHKWTPEELEIVRNFVQKHGRKWKLLADSLGKYRHHVKDAWRRTKLMNCNRGRWKQEEYQSLFDLVNMDLSMKANQERKSKHGMLRDNICWTAISDKMQTRPFIACCEKWYRQLTSPMVAEGTWADADDYHMLDALSSLDACCMEDVDWDNLIDTRSGDVCRKRWGQMVHYLDPKKEMTFSEQVDILVERYRPDMAEAREIYDSKVPIDL